MYRAFNLFTISILFHFICVAQSNELYFTSNSIKNGLSHGVVNCIHQDRQKFIWIGTLDGLNRYDGYNFTVHKHVATDTTSISNSLINCITEDQTGKIWVGTVKGLNCFDPTTERFERYLHNPESNSLCNNYVKSLLMDQNGKLWIGTDNGLNIMDTQTGRFTRYDFDGKLNDSRIYSILKDSTGDIWLATQKTGIIRFNPATFQYTVYMHDPSDSKSVSSNQVYTLYEDSKKRLWVGTWEYGVNLFDRESGTFKRLKTKNDGTGLNNEQIRSIIEYKDGNIWIGTFEGLNVYDTKKERYTYFLRHNNIARSLSHNCINYLFEDEAGSIWLGTNGGGVDLYDPSFSQFKFIDPKVIANHDYGSVGPIVEHDGKIWIGTEGGGIAHYDLKTANYKHYSLSKAPDTSINSNTIRDLCVDKNNNLWIGTYAGGVHSFDISTFKFEKHFDTSNGIENNLIQVLHEDKAGNIWAGTNSNTGIHFKGRSSDQFVTGLPLPSDNQLINLPWIRVIAEPWPNEFWFGSIYFGLFIFKEGKIEAFSTENSAISSDYISVITRDSKDQIWVGTYGGGITLFDKDCKIISTLTVADGLPNDNICSIVEDSMSNMWISTISGISQYNRKEKTFSNFSYQKGNFPIEILSLKSGIYASDGNIYFGGSNGLAYFAPNKIKPNTYVPPVMITSLTINDKEIKPLDETGILPTSINQISKIVLKYNQANIKIGFAALNYIYPQNNKYMYYLEGYEYSWNNSNFQRYATYTNLAPGKYTFRVKASNNSGIWNESGTQLIIHILPPPWKTWWAILLYLVILLAISYGIIHYFTTKISYKNKLRLEQLEKESLEKTHQMRINLFTNFSHELRTPLTLILDPLGKILSDNALPSIYKDSLLLIHRNANKMLALVNQLMDYRKQESGNLKLKVKEGDLITLVQEISLNFRESMRTKNIKFQFDSNEKGIRLFFDPFLLEKVFYNIMSNAVKNTPENGMIQVELNLRTPDKEFNGIISPKLTSLVHVPSYVECSVKDTGRGIKAADLEKIFEPFFQIKGHNIEGIFGTGIGLHITKSIVELHHGVIWAESAPNEGATFRIVLPIDSSLYKEDEFAAKEEQLVNNFTLRDDGSLKGKEMHHTEAPLILVVEDNSEIRSYISNILKPEFIICEAENGAAGIQVAQKMIPDLVISDIMMPVMDGLKFAQILKSEIKTCHIPIVLLTALSTTHQVIEGLNTGADAYITKPFDSDLLKAKVKNLIENRKRLKETYLKSFNVVLPDLEINNIDQLFLEQAYNFVKENIDDSEISIEEFANQLSLSRTQLYRKIKALTDLSPSKFISTLRLKLAAELLLETSLSISEICYKVGFNSPSYFSNCFKLLYGVSPIEYRAAIIRKKQDL